MEWKRLVQYEPMLLKLERQADDFHRGGAKWADFWTATEPRLIRLVGFLADRPGLRSDRAYNAAVRHLTRVWACGLEPAPGLPSMETLEALSHADAR